jgi:hypothetical protein
MSDRDPFDFENLRINPNDPRLKPRGASTSRPWTKKKWERKFVRFPWAWVERLEAVKSGSTYRLALLLIYEHWRTADRPIRLSNILAAEVGVAREAKRRALSELERLGLIRVERGTGKSPLIIPITDPGSDG